MTKFVSSQFQGSEFVTYGADRKFVARFKRGGRSDFIKFLTKNFTVEEYFTQLDQGVAPLTILESRGYVSPGVRKILVSQGYAATIEGRRQYLAARLSA